MKRRTKGVMTMKNVKLTVGIAATVLSVMISGAIAQVAAPNPDAINIESPFTGVVVNINPIGLIVKAEVNSPNAPANTANSGARSKLGAKSIHFSTKGARITRGGWHPCELKDIQRGDSVTITFAHPRRAFPRSPPSRWTSTNPCPPPTNCRFSASRGS